MTLKEAAQVALDVQDACNLSSVTYSMFDALRAIREHAGENWGTRSINTHPIAQLFAYKVSALAGFEHVEWGLSEAYARAEAECRRLAGEE